MLGVGNDESVIVSCTFMVYLMNIVEAALETRYYLYSKSIAGEDRMLNLLAYKVMSVVGIRWLSFGPNTRTTHLVGSRPERYYCTKPSWSFQGWIDPEMVVGCTNHRKWRRSTLTFQAI